MGAASLVVKISADLNEFSRNLNKMTKDVDKASKMVADIGKTMSIAITLPVTLAGLALAKMGAENEAVANKLQRSFGPSVERINGLLEKLGQIVPETNKDLQKMAIQSQDFARGLGMAAPQAELLTEQMLKLAGNISAAKFISMGEALDIVMRSLEGQTRGLKTVGIAISQGQIKQEAYRLGLLQVGQELTPLGTALATYSMLVKTTGNLQNEAAAQHQDAARQLAFLKRDLIEFADTTANLVVPALRVFARVGREIVELLTKIPDWLRVTIMVFGGMLAVLGPTILLVANLARAFVALNAAITLMAEGSAVKKFLEFLVDPEMLLVMAAVALAIGAAVALWKKFHKEVADTAPKMDGLLDVNKLLGGGTTSENMKNPLEVFQQHAEALVNQLQLQVHLGQDVTSTVDELNAANVKALDLYGKQSDKLGEMAQGLIGIYNKTRDILALQTLSRATQGLFTNFVATPGGRNQAQQKFLGAIATASGIQRSPGELKLDVLSEMINTETDMRRREIALNMPDAFNAIRIAALELGEQFRQSSHDFHKAIATLKEQGSHLGGSLVAGAEAGLTSILAALTPFALALAAVGKVMQGFSPIIDKLLGPFVTLGQIMADIVEPILRPLFQALKQLGIVVALAGEIIYTVASGIARLIGNLIVAIGKFIAKIPFLGGTGHAIQAAGNGLLNLATSMSNTAKQLDHDRVDLQNLNFDDAANGLTDLGSAARQTSRELLAVPEGFRLALREFQSIHDPVTVGGSGGGGSNPGGAPSGGPGGGGGVPTNPQNPNPLGPDATRIGSINLQIGARTIAKIVLNELQTASSQQFGVSTRIAEVAL